MSENEKYRSQFLHGVYCGTSQILLRKISCYDYNCIL
jgi:hypothetical protein